ncbi:hypothetical protein FSARC_11236 [Fusarium sarcochroum]|uniref:Uncharacterized protein n=1 Tax=Fusarium sarcochroum TaxID=1208366 RepID=A0A8H4X1K2_9HYPO|nr:hypothetical protein FSARC_11236 [Fusarium sarcochroum]
MLDITNLALKCGVTLDDLWKSDGLFRTTMKKRNINTLGTNLCNHVSEALENQNSSRIRSRTSPPLEAELDRNFDDPDQSFRNPEQQTACLVKAQRSWSTRYPGAPKRIFNDDIEVEDLSDIPNPTEGGRCAKSLRYDDIIDFFSDVSTPDANDGTDHPMEKMRHAKLPSAEEIDRQLRSDVEMSDPVLDFLARLTFALFWTPTPEKPTAHLLDALRPCDDASLSQASRDLNEHQAAAQTGRRFERWLKRRFPDHKVTYESQECVQQPDAVSSGVYVLINIRRLLVGQALNEVSEPKFARDLLLNMLVQANIDKCPLLSAKDASLLRKVRTFQSELVESETSCYQAEGSATIIPSTPLQQGQPYNATPLHFSNFVQVALSLGSEEKLQFRLAHQYERLEAIDRALVEKKLTESHTGSSIETIERIYHTVESSIRLSQAKSKSSRPDTELSLSRHGIDTVFVNFQTALSDSIRDEVGHETINIILKNKQEELEAARSAQANNQRQISFLKKKKIRKEGHIARLWRDIKTRQRHNDVEKRVF